MTGADVRPPCGEHERRLDRALRYFHFFDRAGWTSDQVDGERAWLLDSFEIIDEARAEAREQIAARQRAIGRAHDAGAQKGRR